MIVIVMMGTSTTSYPTLTRLYVLTDPCIATFIDNNPIIILVKRDFKPVVVPQSFLNLLHYAYNYSSLTYIAKRLFNVDILFVGLKS